MGRRGAPGRVRIGCSGWEYRHWRGDFYPADLPRERWLDHYASRFDTVEINNSFYRLPERATVRAWRRQVPPGFLFAWKGSRYLTHMRKLKDPANALERLFERARELGRALGPVLYQLPPRWHRNPERLEAFVRALPPRIRHVVEFRDASWYHEESYRVLRARGVALCLHEMHGSKSPRSVTAPFVYVRFHGPQEATYQGGYPRRVLAGWAAWLARQTAGGHDVYAYFNNDVGGHAPRDAATLCELVAARVPSSVRT